MRIPDLAATVVSQAVTSLINLAFGVVAAAVLTPAQLGLFSLLLIVMYTVQGLVDAVTNLPAMAYKSSGHKHRTLYSATTMLCAYLVTFLFMVIVFVAAPFFDASISLEVAVLITAIIVAESARKMAVLFVRGEQLFFTDITRLVLLAAVVGGAVIYGGRFKSLNLDAEHVLIALLVVQVASLFNLRHRIIWPGYRYFAATLFRHIRMAQWYALGSLLYVGFDAPASFFAAHEFGIEYAGYLRLGLIAYSPFNTLLIVIETWYARVAMSRKSADGSILTPFETSALTGIVSLSAVTSIIAAILAPTLLPTYGGAHLIPAILPIQTYLLVATLNVPRAVLLAILRARGNAQAVFYIMAWGGCAGTVLPVALGLWFGFPGVCAGIFLANLVALVVSIRLVNPSSYNPARLFTRHTPAQ